MVLPQHRLDRGAQVGWDFDRNVDKVENEALGVLAGKVQDLPRVEAGPDPCGGNPDHGIDVFLARRARPLPLAPADLYRLLWLAGEDLRGQLPLARRPDAAEVLLAAPLLSAGTFAC